MIHFYGLILVIPAIFSNISRKIKLNTFSFQLKDLLWSVRFFVVQVESLPCCSCFQFHFIIFYMWPTNSVKTKQFALSVAIVFGVICFILTPLSYCKVSRIINQHQQQVQLNQACQLPHQSVINFTKYKKLISCYNFLSSRNRPDGCYIYSDMANHSKCYCYK